MFDKIELEMLNVITDIFSLSFWSDILKSLIVAGITALFAVFFTKKYIKKIQFTKDLDKYGFKTSISTDNISEREYEYIFSHAKKIKLIYVTGINFFKNIRHQEMIKKSLENGTKIKILLARKNNPFLKDVYNIEFYNNNRSSGAELNLEVDEVHKILEDIHKGLNNKIDIRYYSTEYRTPLVIATFEKKEKKITRGWLHITLPPVKASKHILLQLECKNDGQQNNDDNYMTMLIEHFDAIWDRSVCWEETAEQYWTKKYETALKPIENAKKCLILVAAQHPLENGCEPNEEFKNRLNAAIELYHKLLLEKKEVKIYVPGSLHISNGVADSISLSNAGKKYLLKENVLEEDIYADKMNIKYKKEEGVYNSADECYVASKIYKDENFEKLYCFCSPFQVTKNQLFLLENGVLGYIYSIPTEKHYHNPFLNRVKLFRILFFMIILGKIIHFLERSVGTSVNLNKH